MRNIHTKFAPLLCAGLAISCSEQKEIRVNYEEIGGASAVLTNIRSACELALGAEQAGRYRVTSMTGVYEEFPHDSGEWKPRTYVELELVEAWSPNASDVTVRVAGGPLPDGTHVAQFVTLRDGETIGAILEGPQADNADYRHLAVQRLFRGTDDDMSNGYLSATTVELSALAKHAIKDGECPVDIEYERPESEQQERVDSPPDGVEVPVNQDADVGTPDAS